MFHILLAVGQKSACVGERRKELLEGGRKKGKKKILVGLITVCNSHEKIRQLTKWILTFLQRINFEAWDSRSREEWAKNLFCFVMSIFYHLCTCSGVDDICVSREGKYRFLPWCSLSIEIFPSKVWFERNFPRLAEFRKIFFKFPFQIPCIIFWPMKY